MGYLTLMPTHLIASQDALAFGDSKAVGLAAVAPPTYLDADVLGGLQAAAARRVLTFGNRHTRLL